MNARPATVPSPEFKHLMTRFEPEMGVVWYHMDPKPRPCFTFELLEDFRMFGESLPPAQPPDRGPNRESPVRYAVLASRVPGVFSYGGDLGILVRLIREKSTEGLARYARACIHALYSCAAGYQQDISTISLVQGDALGGGFEAALGNHVIIAERRSQFGFPEVLFNLFPGMGAYTLLSRRLDPARAERMILSGRIFSAAELHDMGVVDHLAEDGEGEAAVYEFIRGHRRRRNAFASIHRVRQRCNPVSYDELADIADIWVTAAMRLEEKDLRMMERLVRSQDRLFNGSAVAEGVGEGYA